MPEPPLVSVPDAAMIAASNDKPLVAHDTAVGMNTFVNMHGPVGAERSVDPHTLIDQHALVYMHRPVAGSASGALSTFSDV